MNNLCKINSEIVNNGYGNSHYRSLQKIIDYSLKNKKEKTIKNNRNFAKFKITKYDVYEF